MTETINVKGHDLEVMGEAGDGQPLLGCPYCAEPYHRNGVGNHMNFCAERPENQGVPEDAAPRSEPEEEETVDTETTDTTETEEETDPAALACPSCGNADDGREPQVFDLQPREAKVRVKRVLQSQGMWGADADSLVEESSYLCASCGWCW